MCQYVVVGGPGQALQKEKQLKPAFEHANGDIPRHCRRENHGVLISIREVETCRRDWRRNRGSVRRFEIQTEAAPRLGSLRIAEFLARGFLVLEGVVPEDVNARVLEVLRERTEHKVQGGSGVRQMMVNVQHYPWKALLSQCFGREPH